MLFEVWTIKIYSASFQDGCRYMRPIEQEMTRTILFRTMI